MGYTHICGYDVDRDYRIPLYMDELTEALCRLNPTLPDDAISDALYKLKNFENGEPIQNISKIDNSEIYFAGHSNPADKSPLSSKIMTLDEDTDDPDDYLYDYVWIVQMSDAL